MIRVQRCRTRGWRAPLCSCECGRRPVYVGRGSVYGNPYRVSSLAGGWSVDRWVDGQPVDHKGVYEDQAAAHGAAVELYRYAMDRGWGVSLVDLERLCGHDLMCWCPRHLGCHADVLLELANKEA